MLPVLRRLQKLSTKFVRYPALAQTVGQPVQGLTCKIE
jgi:hypothetical protein